MQERIEAQRAALGPQRLAELRAFLEAGLADNDRPFPADTMLRFPVPSVENVQARRLVMRVVIILYSPNNRNVALRRRTKIT